jgi:hypothetical protein
LNGNAEVDFMMMQTVLEVVKQHRLAWSSAIVVGLFLTGYGHAPVLPVVAGCILAIGMAVLRAWPRAASRGSK